MNQKKKFEDYFGSSRFMYNCAIDAFEQKKSKTEIIEKLDLKVLMKRWTLQDFRRLVLPSYKTLKTTDPLYWITEIPYDTNQLAIKDLVTAIKGCQKKMIRGKLRYFRFQQRDKKSKIQSFWANDKAISFTKTGLRLFPRSGLGNIKINSNARKTIESLLDIKFKNLKKSINCPSDCQIQKNRGKYYLIITAKTDDTRLDPVSNTTKPIIALDPGVRTFLTGYDQNEGFKFGEDYYKVLAEKLHRIERIKSDLVRIKPKSSTKSGMRHKIQSLRAKLIDCVKNFHYQIASWLTKHYSCILLPTYRTDKLVRQESNLVKPVRKAMLLLSFYKFSQRLEWLASLKRNCKVLRCSEAYTTITCGNCGKQNIMGAKKVYNCSCGYVADRDLNAARNILIRSLTKYYDE